MFCRIGKRRAIRFRYVPRGNARRIEIAGDFNHWQPAKMRKQPDGAYVIDVPVTGGTCQYKFIADGNWVTDPDHSECEPNPFGTMNSVARIEP